MLNDFLQDQAALYVSGAMTALERDQFELVLEFHHELRDLVFGMAEVGAAVTLATQPPASAVPSPGLKARIADLIAADTLDRDGIGEKSEQRELAMTR